MTFADTHTLDVGGEKFVLSYPGPNHEAGNIIIHVPGQRLAMLMDVALVGWAPYRAFGTADSVPGVLRAHQELLKLDFDSYVGGHFYKWGTKKDVQESAGARHRHVGRDRQGDRCDAGCRLLPQGRARQHLGGP